jgi:WhiB family redox-sensing transcriptional regulator
MSAQPEFSPSERWQDDAECLGADPEIFFLEKGGSTLEAKAICATCPVRDECLETALVNVEKHGVWGGKTERERMAIQRQRRMDRINARGA